ncbi:MAG: hypothetical protein WBQ10_09200 [Terriglobales bacterium]
MKVGAENRTKLFVAIGLMAVAVVVLLFNLGSSSPKAATVAPPLTPPVPTSRPVAAATGKAHGKKVSPATRSLDPTLRYDWLKASEDTKYEGTGRNIFTTQAEIPQPIAPAKTPDELEAEKGPPPPPPPPPINLKFFGFASKPGEAKKIFLSEGEDVFIAAEGEVVNRHYKVLRISPTSVEIEDVLNNNRQSIPLTAG